MSSWSGSPAAFIRVEGNTTWHSSRIFSTSPHVVHRVQVHDNERRRLPGGRSAPPCLAWRDPNAFPGASFCWKRGRAHSHDWYDGCGHRLVIFVRRSFGLSTIRRRFRGGPIGVRTSGARAPGDSRRVSSFAGDVRDSRPVARHWCLEPFRSQDVMPGRSCRLEERAAIALRREGGAPSFRRSGRRTLHYAYVFRTAPDSCRKRAVPALTFSAMSRYSMYIRGHQ